MKAGFWRSNWFFGGARGKDAPPAKPARRTAIGRYQLEKELGLEETDEFVEIDELVMRLQSIRPSWSWQEKINPEQTDIF